MEISSADFSDDLSESSSSIAFLDFIEFNDGDEIRGAVLVTAERTEPIEFRCTSPVIPTSLQRTLWGKRLMSHIAVHLMGRPLLNKLNNHPILIVVQKAELVELREFVDVPTVLLSPQDEIAPDEAVGQPIAVTSHPKFVDDATNARRILSRNFDGNDWLEPFHRIHTAVEIIHERDSHQQE